jgi:hypothetical protein
MPSHRSRACASNTHTAHVDVATCLGALHSAYLANNGQGSKMVFIKKTVKTNIFALAPQCHVSQGGNADFGGKAIWKIGRQGDYLMNNWLRAEVSAVTASSSGSSPLAGSGLFLRWTHNFGHNLIEDLELHFSTVPACHFDEFYLDFFSAFSVPAGKRNLYDNMIGNLPELVNPITDVTALTAVVQVLPEFVVNVPLPMPYARDYGIALPTGGLIYNEINLQLCLRDWDELLIVSNPTNAAIGTVPPGYSRQATRADVDAVPTLTNLQLWGNYAIVTADERKRMGKVPRDMIWEITQAASDVSIQTATQSASGYLRYSHAVKALFFGVRNTTVKGQLSNYTTRQALCYVVDATGPGGAMQLTATEFPAPNAFDPISGVTLKYEGADRLDMTADFFSMIQPFYFAYSGPTVTGYHCFAYSTNIVGTDHAGSTDYGKLTNVSMEIELGDDAQHALAGAVIAAGSLPFKDELGADSALPAGYLALAAGSASHLEGSLSGPGTAINQDDGFNAEKQTFELKNACLAHTVLRSIGGGVGFPIF